MNAIVALGARDDDMVGGVGGDAAGLREHVDQSDLAVSLVNHRMRDGANDRDRAALLFFYGDADFGMRDQAVGFEDFGDFALGLNFGEAGDLKANGHERQADGAGLADAQLARHFGDIEDLNVDEVAGADDVVARRRDARRRGGERSQALVGFVGRLHTLRAEGGGRMQHQETGNDERQSQGAQACLAA